MRRSRTKSGQNPCRFEISSNSSCLVHLYRDASTSVDHQTEISGVLMAKELEWSLVYILRNSREGGLTQWGVRMQRSGQPCVRFLAEMHCRQ